MPETHLPSKLTREQAMARFHFMDSSGGLHDGAAAFAGLWSEIPSLRWLGQIASQRPVLYALERIYNIFLFVRNRRKCAC